MTIQRLTRAAALAGAFVLAGAGAAFADDASINETGPDSNNSVVITNSSSYTVSNQNSVSVTNTNNQAAQTGDAVVEGNTSGGSAMSGNASNNNEVATLVEIENGGLGSGNPTGPGGGQGSGDGVGVGGSGSGGSGGGVGADNGVGGMGSGAGSDLMAGGLGGGVATLPEVGCSTICDVSALRAGYNSDDSAANAIQKAKGISTALMALAAILSLVGAGGSAMYATKRMQA